MNLLLDSFWRAVAYCLHPRVIALSLLPLAVMALLALGLGYLLWESAVKAVFLWLEASAWLSTVWGWLADMGFGGFKNLVAPLLLVLAITPVVVFLSLLLVALLMTPAIVTLVAQRRFPTLERKRGGSFALGLAWSLGSLVMAALAMIVSLPLWLVPPLILVLPPLIWGWLTYRVMAFDALVEHASADERRELLRRHRPWLLGMGVATGYLGAAPSVVWASRPFFAAHFFFIFTSSNLIYTLVFAFSSLWFTHYALAALEQMRAGAPMPGAAVQSPAPLALPDEPFAKP
jgi:hypothetical protein